MSNTLINFLSTTFCNLHILEPDGTLMGLPNGRIFYKFKIHLQGTGVGYV